MVHLAVRGLTVLDDSTVGPLSDNESEKKGVVGMTAGTMTVGEKLATLGRTIVASRSLQGMSRKNLSEAAGISYPYLAEIENGTKTASLPVLGKIASALGTDTVALLDAADGGTIPTAVAAPADSLLTGDAAIDAVLFAARAVLLAGGTVSFTPAGN